MSIRLALSVSVAAIALAIPAAAMAVPGDPGISNPVPGVFRLNSNTLEPGCFVPGRNAPVDVQSHLLVSVGGLSSEIHISVDTGAPFSIDQVLVASTTDGYKVYNAFDTGSNATDPDIDPGQTVTSLTSGTAFVDGAETIICVSEDHSDSAPMNEPYNQEAGGLVSAKNRPTITPHVVALGESSIDPLNTFKVAFGYDSTPWYTIPPFLGALGNAVFPTITDPNAIPSPLFLNSLPSNLPTFVNMFPRNDPGPYDAQRVNEVMDARGNFLPFNIPGQGQNFLFRVGGDTTAWIDDGGVPGPGIGLLTTLSRGDFPVSWTLRPSLGAPSTEKSVTFSSAQFDAWEQQWQDYYCGKGPHPTLPLAPGTNSPDPRDCPVIVNVQETLPAPTPSNPNPTVVTVTTPAPPPVVNNTSTTTTVVTPAPAAPVTPAATINTTVAPTNAAIQHDTKVATTCHGSRVISIVWPKSAKSGLLLYRNKVTHAKLSKGRLRATADLRGMVGTPGAYMKVVQFTTTKGGKHLVVTRPFKVC